MTDPQGQATSDSPDRAKRAPYGPPRIERLGSMAELTAFDDVPTGSDGTYGVSSTS